MRSFTGRRAILLARISAVSHALEPPIFGLTLAAGIYLTTHQAGTLVLLDRRGAPHGQMTAPGILLVLGVALVAASLLFFHRKGRTITQRLVAAAVAFAFFAYGYSRELGFIRMGSFFGLSTPTPSTTFVEDFPARPKVTYRVNAWGLRGADFPEKKLDGARRIAVVGDSFVFGSGVEEDGTLTERLSTHLRGRFPGAALEVLNLGVPGNNLLSHLAMLRIAEQHLGADALVLCLTLPNDLSLWDGQEERRAHQRIGGFSFASYMLGYQTAITLWGERNLTNRVDDEGVAFLERETARFAEERGPAAVPLLLFAYATEDRRVMPVLAAVRGTVLVPPVRFDAAHYIPNDGHPTALGNEAFAKAIAAAFQPAWLGAAPR